MTGGGNLATLQKNSILADSTGAELPAPVSMSVGEEVIWSSNTGRVSSGKMMGTVIAEKDTISISWGVLTKFQIEEIEKKIPKGFIKLYLFGEEYEVYRGTLTKEALGYIGDGIFYYKSASTDIVER